MDRTSQFVNTVDSLEAISAHCNRWGANEPYWVFSDYALLESMV